MISGGSGLGSDVATTHPHEWRRRFNSASLHTIRAIAYPGVAGHARGVVSILPPQEVAGRVRRGRTTARGPAAARVVW
jgi:hypothetical protein